MADRFNQLKNRLLLYGKTVLKWLICAICAGLLCGAVGIAFRWSIDRVTGLRLDAPWLLYCLPAAGLLIVLVYRKSGVHHDLGTNLVLTSISGKDYLPAKMAPLIFVASVLTHLCGGSAGREGAALQIGGSLGAWMGRRLRLDRQDTHVITMCGMSALFAALFGTPVTAALFSIEVISIGIFQYSALFPCVLSALIAYWLSTLLGFGPMALPFAPQALSFSVVWRVLLLGLACALASILFVSALRLAGKAYRIAFRNDYLRAAVGGALIVGLTLLLGTRDYNGLGIDVIRRAFSGDVAPWAFALKILFTALTIGAGFKGGEIVPTFFIGAALGCALSGLLGLDPAFAAALGLVALFCGVVNCPVTALALSVELFGGQCFLLFAAACAVSFLLSGYYSLYSGQKFAYSKLHEEYLNRFSN